MTTNLSESEGMVVDIFRDAPLPLVVDHLAALQPLDLQSCLLLTVRDGGTLEHDVSGGVHHLTLGCHRDHSLVWRMINKLISMISSIVLPLSVVHVTSDV